MFEKSIRVLILDDMYSRVIEFEKRLKPIDITDITHVTTAKECIECLSKKKYDLIFLDYDLGEPPVWAKDTDISGGVVAEWIKKHPKNKNKKAMIIIHSSDSHGGAYMKELIPDATLLPRAWSEEKFEEIKIPAFATV
ncbi:MAG: cyclic-phosphate processing receiver domain-containing protein [bacterium]